MCRYRPGFCSYDCFGDLIMGDFWSVAVVFCVVIAGLREYFRENLRDNDGDELEDPQNWGI